MSFKTKTIAVSAVALLAVVGGAYAFMPAGQDKSSENAEVINTVQVVEPPMANSAPVATSGNEQAEVSAKAAAAAPEVAPKDKSAAQTPKKLTREQLTPPPLTEEEKLQKAAQQESNF
jgi:hypothetical protein